MNKNNIKEKERKIKYIFNSIYKKYDLINFLLTLGFDRIWRNKVVNFLLEKKIKTILDVATGTGDLAIILAEKLTKSNIIGIDFSEKMIKEAKRKIKIKKLSKRIKIFKTNYKYFIKKKYFDVITISFGIRNFDNINYFLKIVKKNIKKNGYLIILEFFYPENNIIKFLYKFFYQKYIIFISKILSDNFYAYKYLISSINCFIKKSDLNNLLINNNFKKIKIINTNFGITSIFIYKSI
ncbi:ubiquinone/menaquinone biosynthesis methyltransferase [Candidatus Shikimatogenerans silvanidophilus]|uniref:ubiquinone/menaquinone biosynthesis methyltransferase n=1 Tax=Candidatus Shikimatogenerans silvanidophilus TaxID=2782547 RepID=UPI001BA8B242|nr:ubiquinone/menaquinone biosynthesis methyltransferase [Candidatus Shikimatogenerans silvanidophilus]